MLGFYKRKSKAPSRLYTAHEGDNINVTFNMDCEGEAFTVDVGTFEILDVQHNGKVHDIQFNWLPETEMAFPLTDAMCQKICSILEDAAKGGALTGDEIRDVINKHIFLNKLKGTDNE